MYKVELQKLVNGVWEFLDCCIHRDAAKCIEVLKGFAVSRTNNILLNRIQGIQEVRLVKQNNAEPDGVEVLKYWRNLNDAGWSGWITMADVT